MDESNPVPPSREDYTVTTTDQATGQQQLYFLKPPKSSSSESSSSRKVYQMGKKTLEDVIGVTTGGPQGRRKDEVGHTEDIYNLFATFIRSMLIYQPDLRASANDSLSHPYLLAMIDFPAVQGSQTSASSGSGSGSTASSLKTEEQQKQQTTETGGGNTQDVKPTTSSATTGGTVLPRRRARSAPRLTTSTDEFLSHPSSQAQSKVQAGMVDVTGHSTKKLTPSESSPTKASLGVVSVGEKEKEKDLDAWLMSSKQGVGVVGVGPKLSESEREGVTETTTTTSPSTEQQQMPEREDAGPMETSEVDDEGSFVRSQDLSSSSTTTSSQF